MELAFIVGWVWMMMAMFLARSVSLKEIKQLETEQKAELVNMATEQRTMQIVVLFVMVGGFYFLSRFFTDDLLLWMMIYLAFVIGWMVFRANRSFKKFREKGFEESFIRAQLKASLIRLAGLLGFVACAVYYLA